MKGKRQVEGWVILRFFWQISTNEKRELMTYYLSLVKNSAKKFTPPPALYPSFKTAEATGGGARGLWHPHKRFWVGAYNFVPVTLLIQTVILKKLKAYFTLQRNSRVGPALHRVQPPRPELWTNLPFVHHLLHTYCTTLRDLTSMSPTCNVL